MTDRYEFANDYQDEIVHHCLQSPNFVRGSRDVLDPDLFTTPENRALVAMVLAYFDVRGHLPTVGVMKEEIRREFTHSKSGLSARQMVMALNQRRSLDAGSESLYAKEIKDFAIVRRSHELMARSDDFLTSRDYFGFLQEWEDIISISNDGSAFADMSVGLAERLKSYKQGYTKSNPCLTGIPMLDECMLGQGVGAGEIAIVLGLTGVGKSHFLVHVGAAGVRQKKNVFHVTLEMSRQSVYRRYDQCLAGIPDKKIGTHNAKWTKALRKLPLPKVYEAESNRLSPKALEAILMREKRKHGRPDLIVVDYGMLMVSDRGSMARYEELGDIYAGLRDIGTKLGCPVWSAVQSNRQGYGTEVGEGGENSLGFQHLSKSFDIAMNVDIAVSLNMDDFDPATGEGRARLRVIKNRDARDGVIINVNTDWKTSTITQFDY